MRWSSFLPLWSLSFVYYFSFYGFYQIYKHNMNIILWPDACSTFITLLIPFYGLSQSLCTFILRFSCSISYHRVDFLVFTLSFFYDSILYILFGPFLFVIPCLYRLLLVNRWTWLVLPMQKIISEQNYLADSTNLHQLFLLFLVKSSLETRHTSISFICN